MTVLVIVLARRSRDTARGIAICAIPVLLAIEGLLVTTTMFPRVADKDYYPQTGVTRYLSEHLGHERIAPTGTVLMFATNPVYGLRSVGGHSFAPSSWRRLVTSIGVGASTPTQLRLPATTLRVAQSSALDRLAARYFVTTPYDGVRLVGAGAGRTRHSGPPEWRYRVGIASPPDRSGLSCSRFAVRSDSVATWRFWTSRCATRRARSSPPGVVVTRLAVLLTPGTSSPFRASISRPTFR